MKFRKSIKKISDRGRLRKECGKLHFELLKLKRGETDEITGQPANGLGRFHILEVSTNPRLEFVDENILLVNWLPHHFNYHHYGPASDRNAFTMRRIAELRGPTWKEDLREREKYVGTMDKMYLLCLINKFKQELKEKKSD
jgi:hypothetical protein